MNFLTEAGGGAFGVICFWAEKVPGFSARLLKFKDKTLPITAGLVLALRRQENTVSVAPQTSFYNKQSSIKGSCRIHAIILVEYVLGLKETNHQHLQRRDGANQNRGGDPYSHSTERAGGGKRRVLLR